MAVIIATPREDQPQNMQKESRVYFWNINALKKHIVDEGLSEAQIFYYILLFVALSAGAIEFAGYLPNEGPNWWDYLDSAQSVILTVIGTVIAYRANRGAEGKDFAARYFSIGFVMFVRFIVYLVPVYIALAVYYALTMDPSASGDSVETSWPEFMLSLLWTAAYYLRVAKHVGDTATAPRAADGSAQN